MARAAGWCTSGNQQRDHDRWRHEAASRDGFDNHGQRGLAAGDYIITTYHNDIFTGSPTIDIKVDGVLKVDDLAVTAGAPDDDSAANATYDFTLGEFFKV